MGQPSSRVRSSPRGARGPRSKRAVGLSGLARCERHDGCGSLRPQTRHGRAHHVVRHFHGQEDPVRNQSLATGYSQLYQGNSATGTTRRSRKKSSSAALGPGRTLFGLTGAGATRVAAARVRRGGVDIRGEAMIDFLLGCLRASYGQTLRHEISPAPTGPHSMPFDPISVPDLAGGITHPVRQQSPLA